MNKTSRDKKFSARRLVALLLCCFCLLAALPIAALADTDDDVLTLDAAVTEEQPQAESDLVVEEAPALTFYDRLMSAASCWDIYALLTADENQADALALTGQQLDALTARAWELGDDGSLSDLLAALNALMSPAESVEYSEEDEYVEEDYQEESEEIEEPEEPQEDSEDEYVEESEDQYEEPEEEVEEETSDDGLYWCLMNCESCEEMYDVLGCADLDEVEALDYDELTALIDYVCTLEDDGYQEDLIFDLTALRDNEVVLGKGDHNKPGEGGDGGQGGGNGNECDQSYYQADAAVYYDTMSYNESTGKGTSYADGRSLIDSVKIGTTDVVQANATNPRSASGGSSMSTYFSGADKTTEVKNTLYITPADGYYVTAVVIACTGGNDESAFNCNTWYEGNAFNTTFDVGTSGEVSIPVSSVDFSHRSNSQKVFILIAVAPVPSPLYVEYWPGDITEHTSNTIFSDSDGWTAGDSRNAYGTTSVPDTSYTQFRYTYGSAPTEAANWKHYANSITDSAKDAAAAVGYYFAGWNVEYYTKCTTSTGSSDNDRTYTYTFSDSYGTGTTAQPGAQVHLTTNVKLTAQWEPIKLKVTKTVEGLSEISEHSNARQTYKLTLQKLGSNSEYSDLVTTDYTITGDGTVTYTFAASGANENQVITPGTYKVVETGTYDLTGNTTNAYCTTTYTVEEVTVEADGSVQELKVKNTYSDTPATATITVTKVVSGNMLSHNDVFNFTVTGNVADADKSFTLKHDESKTITVNIGDTITITEDSGSYSTSYKIGNGNSVDSNSAEITVSGDETITFTNTHEVTIDTGVLLDTLPYIIILVIVAAGAVLMLKKRSRRED